MDSSHLFFVLVLFCLLFKGGEASTFTCSVYGSRDDCLENVGARYSFDIIVDDKFFFFFFFFLLLLLVVDDDDDDDDDVVVDDGVIELYYVVFLLSFVVLSFV